MPTTLRTLAVAGVATTVIAVGLAGPIVTAGATPTPTPSPTTLTTTTATVTLSSTRVNFHEALTVTGRLTSPGGGGVAGDIAHIQTRVGTTSKWHNVAGVKPVYTNMHGYVHWTMKPSTSGGFRVYFASVRTYASAASAPAAFRVLPVVYPHLPASIPALTTTHIMGVIHPQSLTGEIVLQRYSDGAWRHFATSTIANGHFSFVLHPGKLGTAAFRVVRRFDPQYATVITKPVTVHVVQRQLEYGDSGPDVALLQRRLTALHYWTGPASDEYGWNMVHAVTVFEKVQGMDPDGQAGVKVWQKLAHPKLVHLRHPESDTEFSVEVNLTKQVLAFAKNGKVVSILDTSTAGGYTFEGSTGPEVAITPTGHFTIQYKITGLHRSDLGTLYDPSYFTNTGYAIHGEGDGNDGGEVPPYANSHGCVRITDSAVIHFYPKLVIGTSVWIYK